jgi:hypothetical protein
MTGGMVTTSSFPVTSSMSISTTGIGIAAHINHRVCDPRWLLIMRRDIDLVGVGHRRDLHGFETAVPSEVDNRASTDCVALGEKATRRGSGGVEQPGYALDRPRVLPPIIPKCCVVPRSKRRYLVVHRNLSPGAFRECRRFGRRHLLPSNDRETRDSSLIGRAGFPRLAHSVEVPESLTGVEPTVGAQKSHFRRKNGRFSVGIFRIV